MVPWKVSQNAAVLLTVAFSTVMEVHSLVAHRTQQLCCDINPRRASTYLGVRRGSSDRRWRTRFSHRIPVHQERSSSLTALRLAMLPCLSEHPAARAFGCLVSAALVGSWVDRVVPNGGILATLAVSALFSGFGLAPRSHCFYDMCWSMFLPASLALLLLAMKEPAAATVAQSSTRQGDSWHSVMQRMATPFCIASMGSVLGCLLAFLVCCWKPSWLLAPRPAAIAASCLAASFIGGSVNFFATAAAIAATNHQNQNIAVNTIVSSMAAADLVVMALYFAVISAALQSNGLRSWFEARHGDYFTVNSSNSPENAYVASNEDSVEHRLRRTLPASLTVSTIALALVRLAGRFESALEPVIPGTACAFLAAATPVVARIIPHNMGFWNDMQNAAGILSSFSFLMLFAAIGITADLEAALLSGPACLIFSGIALTVHGIVALTGSWLLNNVFGKRILFEDVLITSNAAIGGPATAATFCGRIPNNSKAVTIAATVWGVVGYAGGTTIGIALYRFLQVFLV